MILAIDLGGTTAKAAFMDYDNNIIHKFIIPTDINNVIQNMYEYVVEECKKTKYKYEDIDFIATTVCGVYDYKSGYSVWSGNLRFKNYPYLSEYKKIFKIKNVFVMNDSKAAAYGEWKYGAGRKYESQFLYTIGTGIGGGLVFDNKMIFGTNTGFCSEPGHGGGFQNKYQCNCGLNGCVEGLSSATGIEKLLNEKATTSKGKLNNIYKQNGKIYIKDVAKLFFEKNKEVIEIFKTALDPIAKHISVLFHNLDLEVFIIGGGPSKLGEPLIKLIKDICKEKYVLPYFIDNLKIKVAELGNDAGIMGIYNFGREQFKLNNK